MTEHLITVSARSPKERYERVRELLRRGYMPVKFYEKRTEYCGVVDARYVDKDGKQQRMKSTSITHKYCAVLRRLDSEKQAFRS